MKPADVVVLFFACGLLAYLYSIYWFSNQNGHQVVIKTPFEEIQVSLQQDKVLDIKGKLGVSQLKISNGRIRFIKSPCQQKLCIISGWLKISGEFAACLPNGVSIMVEGKQAKYDAIVF